MNSGLMNFGRYLRAAVCFLLVTLALSASAWAQTEAPERPKPSWVMSYVLITLCVGAALFVVCRGTKRFK